MKSLRREDGQAIVEFAFASVIFLMATFFVMDGGRVLWNYVTVSQAAQSAARYAIFHGANSLDPAERVGPGDDAKLKTFILDNVKGLESSRLTVQGTWTPSTNVPGARVTVKVIYTSQPLTGVLWRGQTVTFNSRATMTVQN